MDGNKDEAIRCVRIAEEAIASGNKQRAFKFIKMAQRLNHNLCVDHLLSSCEKLDSSENSASADQNDHKDRNTNGFVKSDEGLSAERSYTEEHVHLIRHINRNKEYYGILGVEKSCSVEEIRKAYRKLSLKVHPDKNKAAGSEEAFKKLCKAFKCLSDGDSRMQYDQGLVDEFEHNQQYNNNNNNNNNNVRRRRTSAGGSYYDDEFDPDEIFRAFFGQEEEVCRARHVCRCRGMDGQQGGGPDLIVVLQMLPLLLFILLAYLPFL